MLGLSPWRLKAKAVESVKLLAYTPSQGHAAPTAGAGLEGREGAMDWGEDCTVALVFAWPKVE
jgi:hypothetical protein